MAVSRVTRSWASTTHRTEGLAGTSVGNGESRQVELEKSDPEGRLPSLLTPADMGAGTLDLDPPPSLPL